MIYFGFRGMLRNALYTCIGFAVGFFVGTTGFVFAGVIDPDWPDAIVCDGGAEGHAALYLTRNPSSFSTWDYESADGLGVSNSVIFDGDGIIISGMDCEADDMAEIIAEGHSRNFGDGSTGGATTTATTSEMLVHNPTLDMFLGIMLFLVVFFFWIWFFRRPYDTH